MRYAWLIPLFPFATFVFNLFFGKKLPRKGSYVAIASISLSLVLSLFIFGQVINGRTLEFSRTWLTVGKTDISMGFLVDQLTAVMLLVITTIGLAVLIYAVGYMQGESRFNWFFGVASLFLASMLSLVLANNFLQMYISWEFVGFSSYLLIGFWFEKKAACDAAKKAFITAKIGDVGFLLGIVILFTAAGTFNFSAISKLIESHYIGTGVLTVAGLLLFWAAMAKSAQFPLHTWLPDAMQGPTPSSVLIHTLAAGIYLAARSFFIFKAALPSAMVAVTVIGTITAVMAATIAVTMSDVKKVLAYSTISQLGYMMVALGVGAYVAAIFHLVTHAFFKALLFLGAGSIIHGTGTQDMYDLGSLSKKMKITTVTFLIGSLSLAGMFPLAGFWSKDEILAEAFKGGHYLVFAVLLFTAFLTALYMGRLCFLVFFGKERNRQIHAHESPATITIPLLAMAIPAALIGFIGSPLSGGAFSSWLGAEHAGPPSLFLMASSLLVVLAGVFSAWAIYHRKTITEDEIKKKIALIYGVLQNKYFFDEIYDRLLGRPALSLSYYLNRFDGLVVDGAVRAVASTVVGTTREASWFDRKVDYIPDVTVRIAIMVGQMADRFERRGIDRLVNALGIAALASSARAGRFDRKVDHLADTAARAAKGASRVAFQLDKIVDRIVNGIGQTIKWTGEKLRSIQTGKLPNYIIYLYIASIVFVIIALLIAWYVR